MLKRSGFVGVVVGLAIAAGVRGSSAQTPPVAVAAARTTSPAAAGDPSYRDVRIPAGTKIGVRLNTGVSSYGSRVEQPVDATVIAPLRIRGEQVIPAGSEVSGDIVAVQRAGKVKGRARVAIRFRTLKVGSDAYPIAAQVSRIAPATKAKDAEKIGIPAAAGAAIGAAVGGGKGAAIGAAAGGGAGTAVVLSTPGKEVSLPKGSIVSLSLQRAITVRVPVK